MAHNDSPSVWTSRAMAFVTRSHRHLWGKNNEGPLAFLFKKGLTNEFCKKMLMGWNKFGQNRPAENWGIDPVTQGGNKLFLSAGIVVPYIINQQLASAFIHTYEEEPPKTRILPGSQTPTMVLGSSDASKIIIIPSLMDGLFLVQETGENACVIIHPDKNYNLSPDIIAILTNEKKIIWASKKKERQQLKLLAVFSDHKPSNHEQIQYHKKEDLLLS